jgi:hypothetical protein
MVAEITFTGNASTPGEVNCEYPIQNKKSRPGNSD